MATDLEQLKARCVDVSERGLITSMLDTIAALTTDATNLSAAGVSGLAFLQEQMRGTELGIIMWAEMFLQRLEIFEKQCLSLEAELCRMRKPSTLHHQSGEPEAVHQKGHSQAKFTRSFYQQENDNIEAIHHSQMIEESSRAGHLQSPNDDETASSTEAQFGNRETLSSTNTTYAKKGLRQLFRRSWFHLRGKAFRR